MGSPTLNHPSPLTNLTLRIWKHSGVTNYFSSNSLVHVNRLVSKKAFQLYATSKIELASHKALTRWCNRATKFWSHLDYIHEIKTKEIEAWRQSLQQEGLGNQSIKHAMNQVGATIKYMKKMGYLVSDIDMPKIRLPKGRLRYLSFEEETQFLKVITNL